MRLTGLGLLAIVTLAGRVSVGTTCAVSSLHISNHGAEGADMTIEPAGSDPVANCALPFSQILLARHGRWRGCPAPCAAVHPSATPASAKLDMPEWQAAAALTIPSASAAPEPSPNRKPRFKSGVLPSSASTW